MDDGIIKEIKKVKNSTILEEKKTNIHKLQFIDEIKNGLGDEIKENIKINKQIIIENPKSNFLKKIIQKIFKMF